MAYKLLPVATFCKSRFLIAPMPWVLIALLTGCGVGLESVAPTPNPNPKEIYEITVTVENAPGEFISVEGAQGYSMSSTWKCLPKAPFTGAPTVSWMRDEPFVFKKTSATTFVARSVQDRYIPNDDYGLGICRWQPSGIDARLSNGINTHTIVISPRRQMLMKRAYRLDLFRLARHPPSKVPPPPGGWPSEKLPPDISGWDIEYNQKQHNQVFSNDEYFFITMTVKKVSP